MFLLSLLIHLMYSYWIEALIYLNNYFFNDSNGQHRTQTFLIESFQDLKQTSYS